MTKIVLVALSLFFTASVLPAQPVMMAYQEGGPGCNDQSGMCRRPPPIIYREGDQLSGKQSVMKLTLKNNILRVEFIMRAEFIKKAIKKENQFLIAEEVTLNQGICKALGVRTMTIAPGRYAIDFTKTKDGSIILKTKDTTRKQK